MTKRKLLGRRSEKVSLKLLYYVFLSVLRTYLSDIGDDKIGGTPVPISNTEVKPYDAEDTRGENLWENMGLPIFLYNPC